MNYPLVSIVTPCYNGESYLDRYFNSILNQTYPNIELIFVNDGSTDRTEEIANSYREKLEKRGIQFTYLYQENAGQAAALNRGLKLFRGEYLTWPDSDDEMVPEAVAEKVDYLLKNPDVEMVRSNGIYYNCDTQERRCISKECLQDKEDILEDLVLLHTYGCCGCYMISKRLFLQCYPNRSINESRVGQNWQMLVPAASFSLCGYIDKEHYIVNEHIDSHSRKEQQIQRKYERWDQFTEVVLEALTHCKPKHLKLKRKVLGNLARQKFYYAVSVQDRCMLLKTIVAMFRYREIDIKELLLFCKYIIPIKWD